MGWLNSEKPPEKYNPAYIRMMVERIRVAVNFLDPSNFPVPLPGSSLIAKYSLPVDRIMGAEWQLPIIALAIPHQVSATTPTNVGPYVYYTNAWGSVKLRLEVTGGSSNSAATATFELHGANGKITSVSSNTGQIEFLRSNPIDPPSESQTMLLKVYTSNASYPAVILGAKLVIAPS